MFEQMSAQVRDVPGRGLVVRIQLAGGGAIEVEPQEAAAYAELIERTAFDAVHESRARRRSFQPEERSVIGTPCAMPNHVGMGPCMLAMGHLGVHVGPDGGVWS